MNSRSFKIHKESLQILFFLIPFFIPDGILKLYGDGILESFFLGWRVLSFCGITVKFISNKKTKIDINIILIFIYEIFLLFSCIMNNESFNGRIVNCGNFLGIMFIFKYYAIIAPQRFIKIVFSWLAILVIINLLLTIIFPMGLNHAVIDSARINFLGKDNMISLFFLIVVIFCMLYANVFPNSRKPLIVFICIILSQIYYFSGSGIVAFTIIVGYLILPIKGKFFSKIFRPINFIIAYIFFEIVIVLISNTDMFSFIFNLLGKDATFTDRTFYWNMALEQISYSPWFGLGNGTVQLWSNSNYSHNAILDVTMKGGVIGLFLWLVLIIYPFVNLKKISGNSHCKVFLSFIVFSMLVIGLMEGLEDRIAFYAIISSVCVFKILASNNILKDILLIKRVNFKKIKR